MMYIETGSIRGHHEGCSQWSDVRISTAISQPLTEEHFLTAVEVPVPCARWSRPAPSPVGGLRLGRREEAVAAAGSGGMMGWEGPASETDKRGSIKV